MAARLTHKIGGYDFEDQKEWQLYLGSSLEGQITWFATDNPECKKKEIEPGYHLDMVDHAAGKFVDLGVFSLFSIALERAHEYINSNSGDRHV